MFGDPATRRTFLKQVAGTGAALAWSSSLVGSTAGAAEPAPAASPDTDTETTEVRLLLNGREITLRLDPRVTLLDALREHLQLTGTKKGCDHGQCGACTVLINGRRINSCLSLAVTHQDDEITTILCKYPSFTTEASLHSACKKLVEAANARGGADNITVMLVALTPVTT